MTKKENNESVFSSFLKGVKPLKKSNKIIKKVIIEKKLIQKNTNNNEKKENKPTSSDTNKTFEKEVFKNNKKHLEPEKIQINKKIDLHGHTLEEAKNEFINVITDCYEKNLRCILFITGKGLKRNLDLYTDNKLYYGKIRNNFMDWVADDRVSSKILTVQQANIKHGADGAFYVYLRKN
jgi:DNA-nicking Smr family endonuclease